MHTHTVHTCTHTHTTLLFGRGYWGVGRTLVTPSSNTCTHTRTHKHTNSCPLTLDDPSRAAEALSSSSPLLVFLCCCYGFLFSSWGFHCFVTAVPVYPVTIYCTLCLPSPQKLLPLLRFRFASQVASNLLYCSIFTAKLITEQGEVMFFDHCVRYFLSFKLYY